MWLRFLSDIIKSSNEQLRSKSNGKFTRLKIWLYQWLLRRLLKTYLHYAISDTVIINNGDIKIVHEFRDLGFESELVRNRIDFKSEMISHAIPVSMRKNKATRNFSYFNFKNLLSIYVDGKELFIKHDEEFSIDGTIEGKLKCSSQKKCISQTIIEILTSYNSAPTDRINAKSSSINSINKTLKDTHRKQKNQQLFTKDKEILSIGPTTVSKINKEENICDNQPKIIKKRGFEIDTSF